MNFFHLMLDSSEILRPIYPSAAQQGQLFNEWREYNRRVPSKGAVLLNPQLDKCLMVQPWRGEKWSYPSGKINEEETEDACAIREVWEETGIDISGRVDTDSYVKAYVPATGKEVKLFLVPGISDEVPCGPTTRKEISKIGWIALAKLPGWEKGTEESSLRFFGVEPFVASLRKWVLARRSSLVVQGSTAPPNPRKYKEIGAAPNGRNGGRGDMAKTAGDLKRTNGHVKSSASARAKEGTTQGSDKGSVKEASLNQACLFQVDVAKVMQEWDSCLDKSLEERGRRK